MTGLTAAYALGLAGIPTVLAESSGRLGGKVPRPAWFVDFAVR